MTNTNPQPGQPIRLSAEWVRRMNAGIGNIAGQPPPQGHVSSNVILVQNAGDPLPARSIVQIDTMGIYYDDNANSFIYNPLMQLCVPVQDDENLFLVGVTQDYIKQGGCGKVLVSGLAVCQIDIKSTLDLFARVSDSTTSSLESAPWGTCRIAYAPAGYTGMQWCIVELNIPPVLPAIWQATADQSGDTVTAKPINQAGTLRSGDPYSLKVMGDAYKIREYDELEVCQMSDGNIAVYAAYGNHKTTYFLPVETDESSETSTWDINDQPTDKQGVTLTMATRCFWEGVGHDLVFFTRDFVFDSKGALISISSETCHSFAPTGNC